MRSEARLAVAVLVAAAVLGACGGGGGGGGNGNNPAVTLSKATSSGDAQTDTIGAPLAAPLRVLVQEDGAPKAGATVTWTVLTGGGQLSSATSQTGADGVASIDWTLGNTAGAQTARAAVSGASGSPLSFSATATAGHAATLVEQAGENQSGILSAAFPTPLTVQVNDRAGNAVSGVTVNWAVTSGPVSLTAATSQTNASGVASMTVSGTGAAGTGVVGATSSNVAGVASFTGLEVFNATRRVTVGAATLFRSNRNNSSQPAVDTVQAGQGVLWVSAGGTHTVESTGATTFTSSGTLATNEPYLVIFNNAGTFQYDCAVHGAGMTGRIVVQ